MNFIFKPGEVMKRVGGRREAIVLQVFVIIPIPAKSWLALVVIEDKLREDN
jgi:hypothetical protein